MTIEQFENLNVGDKVRHPYGGIGIVTEKDGLTYTVKDKGFDQGVMEWLAKNSEKEEKTLSEMIEILSKKL